MITKHQTSAGAGQRDNEEIRYRILTLRIDPIQLQIRYQLCFWTSLGREENRSSKMGWLHLYNDVLPFTAMVTVESANVGLNVLFKAATMKGMSYYVFIVYSSTIGTVLFLPVFFFYRGNAWRRPEVSSLNFPIISRISLLALIGFVAQLVGYKGIEYTSPTLASALSNLIPAFTFVLAAILRFFSRLLECFGPAFRMEKMDVESSRTRAKIVGTIVCISGALVVVLYKGPTVLSAQSATLTRDEDPSLLGPIGSDHLDWLTGGVLLAAEYLLFSVWFILQAQIMKIFPEELTVTFLYNVLSTAISAPVCLIGGRDLDAWKIRDSASMTAILFSAFVGSCFSNVIVSWGSRLKGPVYMTMFKPLSIAIAAIMGVVFLGDALHLGSVIGAVIMSIGFYAVIWGKADEDHKTTKEGGTCNGLRISTSEKVPLLHNSNEDS